jgi:hypothetical protein
MGVLNQASEFNGVNVQQQLEREYQATILPIMQKIFLFFKEIVEHLNYLEKPIEIEEYSRDYPQMDTLTQTHYKINTDGYAGFADFNRLMQINLTFTCQGNGEFTYVLEGKVRIEQEVAFLHSRNVPFTWNQYISSKGIESSTFTITRKIPVRFRFEVDFEQSKIKLSINNHENFNIYSKAFAAEAINELLLDEVIRFLLRQDGDFIRLDIISQNKERIQKKAEEEQLQRAKWLEDIKIEEPIKSSKKESDNGESVFFNRIKSFTGLRNRTTKENQ